MKKSFSKSIMIETQTFFGYELKKGYDPSPLNYIWLEFNCNAEEHYKRFSYNELKNSLFTSFIIYCRKRYAMSPFLYKDMSLDIFITFVNRYISNDENYDLLLNAIITKKVDTFFNKFIDYIAMYFMS